MTKHFLVMSAFALAGWTLAFHGAHFQGDLIQQWRAAANEMFFRACDGERERYIHHDYMAGHMVQLNCLPSVNGTTPIFSLPPQPDDGSARP